MNYLYINYLLFLDHNANNINASLNEFNPIQNQNEIIQQTEMLSHESKSEGK